MENELFKNYPLTAKFLSKLEFSEISGLYFQTFPEDKEGFYLPTLLKNLNKENKTPEFLHEIADLEISMKHLLEMKVDYNKITSEMSPGEVTLNPSISIHRFNYDILSFIQKKSEDDNLTPSLKNNILIISKNENIPKLHFYKANDQAACMIDYLAEGRINLRLLSTQLERNFSSLFPDYAMVLETLSKLKKKFIVLEK